MLNLLFLIPLFPFLGFLILALFGARLDKKIAGGIGVSSVGLSALVTILIGYNFLSAPPSGYSFSQNLWTWFSVAGFEPGISLYLDAMSLVFIFVITFVGFLIHLYSSEFMWNEEGYSRFFAYMNLFVGSMLMLVLSDNLLLLYLGWEGVGLCSFLLIGFWYRDRSNAAAARKAFIVTRVGDTAMAIGLFLLVKSFNTLNIQDILIAAPFEWSSGSNMAVAASLLLLGGALGKSAQLPLQTWLPDAMAGPSPVSALIHAATMVTAGVYLIARTNVLFELAPAVQLLVAVIGAFTLLYAGISALCQHDIKRVLAYSTISQIGYMFLALGVGAWSAAVFHFMIHAFFKALLFLGAGVVIWALHHEHDMFKMGGVKKLLPVTFWTFLAGSAALAALPLITAGFYSKDAILWYAFASPKGSAWLWLAGLTGAFITAIYTFRMVFVTFYGKAQMQPHQKPGAAMKIPLVVLGILSLVGGFIQLPHTFGHVTLFSDLLENSIPALHVPENTALPEIVLQIIAALLTLGGIYIAWLFFLKNRENAGSLRSKAYYSFFHKGWEFDRLYDKTFVAPVLFFSRINKNDFIDKAYSGISYITVILHKALSISQSGKIRWYAAGIVIGAIITLTLTVFI